jgi:hypothetical protein
MAKIVHNDVLDAALNLIKNNCNLMTACSAQPTSLAEATTTYKLADVSMATGDFTVSDGDTNGRKIRVAAKSAVPVDTTGTATHIALCDATRLMFVTTCTSQGLTGGNTADFPAWDYELADPT